MLQIQDLRLGVLLYDSLRDKTIEVEIKHFQQLAVSEHSFKLRYLPIPLSEEWLLKFGFKRFPWGLSIDKLLFKDNLNHPCEELTLEVGNGFKATVKTVHELQNLYKSLTGKELKLL